MIFQCPEWVFIVQYCDYDAPDCKVCQRRTREILRKVKKQFEFKSCVDMGSDSNR